MTARAALAWLQQQLARQYDERESRNIARLVLEDVFQYVPAEADRSLSEADYDRLMEINRRLSLGEPVQYVLGEADFYGLKFQVDQRVLIPRPETEELVHWVLQMQQQGEITTDARVLDIGTGSGCIPITLKHELSTLEVHALDVRADILELAAVNAARNQVAVTWHQLDVLEEALPFEPNSLDLILSNPPYIPPAERSLVPEHVRAFEPHLALFVPQSDPLLFYRRIAQLAPEYLQIGGYVLVETNEHSATEVAELFGQFGYKEVVVRQDLARKDRMVRARKA